MHERKQFDNRKTNGKDQREGRSPVSKGNVKNKI